MFKNSLDKKIEEEWLWKAEQMLGKALEYPRYCDGVTEKDDVYVGGNTLVALAREAAHVITLLKNNTRIKNNG